MSGSDVKYPERSDRVSLAVLSNAYFINVVTEILVKDQISTAPSKSFCC